MKTFFRSVSAVLLSGVIFFLFISTACEKDKDENNGNIFMDENWLIGTWEATTPVTGDPLFDNKKIQLVFNQVFLKQTDTVPHNTVKLWYYNGTLSWDQDNSGNWSWDMKFLHSAYPAGYNSILWQSMTMVEANTTVNTISLRVGDTLNLDPNPELDFDLDWGPYNDYNRVPPTSLDFYGDIEIYMNGTSHVAYYPPDAGKMIRFTKK